MVIIVSEEDSGDRDSENADTTSAGPQPQEGTTHTQGEKLPPGPKDLSQLPYNDPTCPDLKRYPATEYSSQSRSFNKNWRDQHSWLEYSVTQDAPFCFASCQNEAQRDHREGSQSDNRGNFLELLNMISGYDEIVKKKLSGSSNAKYTYHDIQNELLDIIAGIIRKDISKEVMEAEHFALMVDKTKDVSKQEQLSIVNWSALASVMTELQSSQGTSVAYRRGYVYCYAHRLNLVLVDCVHNVQAAAELFVTIQKLYKFLSTSVVHEEFLKVQKELEPVNQHIVEATVRYKMGLPTCCLSGCEKNIPAIVTTLKHLVEGDNVLGATESKGLCILLDQQFVTTLVAIDKLMLMTKQLSDHLQSTDLQLASAEDLVLFPHLHDLN
ncbi:uncharacterized protein LOC143227363 [Tachypleus tridentatus]|uniref:uncharacterized protein LOC143227363 n=1 Tax=Tachypleus tridentatus TaxID=6853 RepID=UPI003FD63732